ncbi:MAG: CPBP family intramembrane metalloprotease [Gemmatimonadetes bacterium]|nr:CPBP family intramembrane metalloprotease [Gemmatimonadota bacterium]
MALPSYWAAAREPRYSLTLALPLLLLYEGLSALLSGTAISGVRNGADVLLKTMFVTFGGRNGLATFGVLLLGAGLLLIRRDVKRHPGPVRVVVLGGMMLESVCYAALFGVVVSALTGLLLHVPLMTGQGPAHKLPLAAQLLVSLGAGIYEELLFRVLLVSALAGLLVSLGGSRRLAIGLAVFWSAVIFSAFHYVGPFGDALELGSFTFRAIAGVMFSGLYVARGFGITAWTHALYDVGLALAA